jgi:hypothetical protein
MIPNVRPAAVEERPEAEGISQASDTSPNDTSHGRKRQTPVETIGAWKIVVDVTGKRCTAQCSACGSIRELSTEALQSGKTVQCSGCVPVRNPTSHSQRSNFPKDVAHTELRGAKKRHKGVGL